MKKTGVYEIRCTVNGKVYVGSAAYSFHHRWKYHRLHLQRGDHDNKYLQAAWTKHGEASFEFLVLEECLPEQCIAREQFWIDAKHAASRDEGFNLAPNAGSSLGFRHTEESKAKVVAFLRGRKLSAETRSRMSAARANPTDEYRAKMSAAKRGEVRSPETRAKMGAAKRGTKASPETRAKIGNARRGRKHSNEAKMKMSLAKKGKEKSQETRAKMSAALRKRHAQNRAIREANGEIRIGYPLKANREICGKEYDKIRSMQKTCDEECRRKHRLNLVHDRQQSRMTHSPMFSFMTDDQD